MDLERARHEIARHGCEVLLALAPWNVQALTGVYFPTHRIIPERWIVAVVPASSGEPTLVCSDFDAPRSLPSGWRLVPYPTDGDPVEVLGSLPEVRAAARVAADAEAPASHIRRVEDLLGRVADASDVLRDIRAVKDDREVEHMRKAARGTRRAVLEALAAARPGVDEWALATAIRARLVGAGAECVPFLVLGGRAAAEDAHPTPRQGAALRSGDVLRIDVGGSFEGWLTDLAWTAAVGQAADSARRAYRIAVSCLNDLIDLCRPGIAGHELYASAAERLRRQGLRLAAPHVGHGIGLGVHDAPALSSQSAEVVQEGNVICLEVVTVQGGYRVHVEETVWVTRSGCVLLSDPAAPPELPEIRDVSTGDPIRRSTEGDSER
ncbi:MAG: aminopeptidase P family protein [Clostridia bacterium]|nr:aminopeptidase P family protein [Clostridia bacterium]